MADFDIHYDPITVNTDKVTVEIAGLDDTHNTITLATPQPLSLQSKSDVTLEQTLKTESHLATESKLDLAITQPIKTESTAEFDIKPLAFDQCLRVSFGPLPPTCIQQPYQHHVGFTLFGLEVFGFNLVGEAQVMVTDIPPKPHVAWGGQQSVPQQHATHHAAHIHDAHTHDAQPAAGGGLKIRLDK
jgi:hypothetical protein